MEIVNILVKHPAVRRCASRMRLKQRKDAEEIRVTEEIEEIEDIKVTEENYLDLQEKLKILSKIND